MKKAFTAGAISGISALALAIPVLAQVGSAQSPSSTAASTAPSSIFSKMRAPFTQVDVQAMIERDEAFLANIDAAVTLQKSATQTHRDALAAALTITDEIARREAVQAAHEALRATMVAAIEANPDWKAAMHFGKGKGHHGGRGHGPAFPGAPIR